MEDYIIICPHCHCSILVDRKAINCGIFRHGVLISNHQPIDPHLSKEECDRLFTSGLIYGCGKPFRVIVEDGEKIKSEICDYI